MLGWRCKSVGVDPFKIFTIVGWRRFDIVANIDRGIDTIRL